MTKNFLTSLLTISLIFFVSNVNAQTGYGIRGCGQLISAIDTNNKKDEYNRDLTRMVVQGWIAGYITAYNSWVAVITKKKDTNVIATTDIDGVWQSVLNYCRANPLKNVNDAISETIEKLETQSKSK